MKGIALALCAAFLAAAPAYAERTLRYSSWLPTAHWMNTDAMGPWMEEVEAATNGTVKVEQLPKSVGAPAAQFDVCRDGLADICVIVVGYTPGRFPLAEVGELPFMGDNPRTMSPKFDAFYRDHFLEFGELKGVHPLAFIKSSSGNIFTREDKPLRTLDDVRGLKVRSPGRAATSELELLGAVPVLKSSSEAYELLSTGVIDGSMMLTESVYSTNSLDLLKNALVVPGGFFSSTLIVVINADTWDSLTPEERDQIMSVSGGALSARFGNAYGDADEVSMAAMTEAGYVFTRADGEFLETTKSRLKPLDDDWIARAGELGVPEPDAILDALRATLSE